MALMRWQGLVRLLSLVSLVMLALTSCAEQKGEPDQAGQSRLTIQLVTAEQTSGGTSRAVTRAQARQVMPGDRDFLTRLDLRVEAADLAAPITQSVTLTETDQQEITVNLLVPTGSNRRVIVSGFNALDEEVFHGEKTVDLTQEVQDVTITLLRQFLPAVVTATAFANRSFAFAEGGAFGIGSPVTLTFGAVVDNSGPFRLTTNAFTASGQLTLSPQTVTTSQRNVASEGQIRQDGESSFCTLTITESDYPSGQGPQKDETLSLACQQDAIDDSLSIENLNTGVTSVSAPPTLTTNRAPNAAIDAPADNATTITAGQAVTFAATCSDPDNTNPLNVAWNLGGGAINVTVEDPGAVTFATPGTFNITFTCTDALGASASATRTVTVEAQVANNPPNGTIDAPADNITTITAGEVVTFAATCNDPDNNTPLSFDWNFGGGATNVTVEDPGAVTFDTPGTFTVTFTCTDALGAVDTSPDTRTVTVEPAEPPPNTVRIGSPPGPVIIGTQFTVPIMLNPGDISVISYMFDLTFNPDVVQVIDIEAGAFPFDTVVKNVVFALGMARFAAHASTFDAEVSGTLTLARVTFQVVGNSGDTTTLRLNVPGDVGVLVNNSFEAINTEEIAFESGLVTVQ